ncbi:MAG: hypothetical protein AB1762_06290 [Gemmatimonadota bacterium]
MSDATSWKAGALLYSGRPDPAWDVGENEALAWVKVFENLTMTRTPVPSQSRLGYRGAWLQAPDGRRWNAFLSVVWQDRDRRPDVGRGLEQRLLETAPSDALPNGWRAWLKSL